MDVDLTALAPLAGHWELRPELAVYVGPQPVNAPAEFGLAIADDRFRMRSGRIRATVLFPNQRSVGRLVFGRNPSTNAYFSAGIGGYHYGYVLDEYIPGTGWRGLRTEGDEVNISTGTPYKLEVHLRGQSVRLFVNGVNVLEGSLPNPISGDQAGLFANGVVPVHFSAFSADVGDPQAFVVTQYGEPYEVLYADVIAPVAKEMGFYPYRAKDLYRPGIILQDIVQGLVESDVVIAEITPANPNVFYELGYAHAKGKPTILLAERSSELPFDVQGYRCIFYDDTIGGKKEVKTNLKKHLEHIKGTWAAPAAAE
jgi:hypothetical protein